MEAENIPKHISALANSSNGMTGAASAMLQLAQVAAVRTSESTTASVSFYFCQLS